MPQSLTRVVDILSYLLHSGSWVCLVHFFFEMKEDQNNTLGKYDSSQLQLFESATAKKDGDPLKSNSIHFSFVRRRSI